MPLWIITMCIRFWFMAMHHLVSALCTEPFIRSFRCFNLFGLVLFCFHSVFDCLLSHSISTCTQTSAKVGHLLQIHFQHLFIWSTKSSLRSHGHHIHESGEKRKAIGSRQFEMFTVNTLSVSSGIRLVISYGHLVGFQKNK